MSDLQQHFEQRGQAGEPAVCPSCRGPVIWIGPTDDAPPYLTCQRDRESHFEWRRKVERELVDVGDVRELEVVVPELVGLDYSETVGARLGPLAAAHFPLYGRPPLCAGCRPDQGLSRPTVRWPCMTAGTALRMLDLQPRDIAITKE